MGDQKKHRTQLIAIPEFMKKNILLLWPYITLRIIVASSKSVFAIMLLIFLAVSLLLFILFPLSVFSVFFHLIFLLLLFLNIFYFVIMPVVVIALEEAFHMAVCIQQGNAHSIMGVIVSYDVNKRYLPIFMNSVVTKFRGNFTLSERIQIHGAAPLLMLLVLSIFFTLVLLLTEIPNKYIIWLWATLSIAPIGSLIPHKLVVESDGYQVVKCARYLKFSALQTIRELLFGMLLGIRYLFLGSWGERKYDALNTRLMSAFEFVKNGDYKNALTILEKELKRDASDPEVCNNIAWCYAELGTNIEKAITLAEKAVELMPNDALYHDTLGWCYYKKGDLDKARDCVLLALKIEPDNLTFQDHLKTIDSVRKSKVQIQQ